MRSKLGAVVYLAILFLFLSSPARVLRAADKADQGKGAKEKSWMMEEEDNLGKADQTSDTENMEEELPFEPTEGTEMQKGKEAPAGGEAASAKKEEKLTLWDRFAPSVEVGMWGQEIRIIVTPDKKMDLRKMLEIQSVKLETETGKFLGLKTYGPNEKTRTAEFMVNPELLKLDKVRIVVSSTHDGEWKKVVSLNVPAKEKAKEAAASVPASQKSTESSEMSESETEAPAPESVAPAPAAAPKEQPKKKGWLW